MPPVFTLVVFNLSHERIGFVVQLEGGRRKQRGRRKKSSALLGNGCQNVFLSPPATMLVSNANNPLNSVSSAASAQRGAFILLEGVDRCGKTTQCSLLLKHLVSLGVAAAAMRFPDRTTAVGNLINQYLIGSTDLDDRAIHLLFSSNRWEGSNKLEQHLFQQGQTVICDRYAYSGVAFTSAKPRADQGGPLPLEWCRHPDVGLPAPDCVIFLDLSQEEAEQRGG